MHPSCVIVQNLIALGPAVWAYVRTYRQKKWVPRIPPFKVAGGYGTDTDRWAICDFLLVIRSNNRPISYRYRGKRRFRSKITTFSHSPATGAYVLTYILGFCNDGGSRKLEWCPYQNVEEKHPDSLNTIGYCHWTDGRTYGRTDGRTDRIGKTVSRSACYCCACWRAIKTVSSSSCHCLLCPHP